MTFLLNNVCRHSCVENLKANFVQNLNDIFNSCHHPLITLILSHISQMIALDLYAIALLLPSCILRSHGITEHALVLTTVFIARCTANITANRYVKLKVVYRAFQPKA